MNDLNNKVEQISSANGTSVVSSERLPRSKDESRKTKSSLRKRGKKTSSKEGTLTSEKKSRDGSSMNVSSQLREATESQSEDPYSETQTATRKTSSNNVHKVSSGKQGKTSKQKSDTKEMQGPVLQLEKSNNEKP